MDKFLKVLVTLIVVVVAANRAEANDKGVCDQVSCSGHGSCVVQEGVPICACDADYVPDRKTGLNCILPAQQKLIRRQKAPTLGWAKGAAVAGFISSGLVGAFGTLSAGGVYPYSDIPEPQAWPIVSLGTAILMGQVVSFGAYSARRSYGVSGAYGALIAGRHLLGVATTAGMFYLLDFDSDLMEPLGWLTIGSSFASLIFYSVDALVAHRQASRLVSSKRSDSRLGGLSPTMSIVSTDGQTSGATLGLTGRF